VSRTLAIVIADEKTLERMPEKHFTNIWNAITHTHKKKIFWDCKLKISCVERDSKYFLRDLNILISFLPPIHISNAIHLKHSVVFFLLFFTNSKIAAIFVSPSTVDAPKILNFIHFFLFCLNLSPLPHPPTFAPENTLIDIVIVRKF